MLAEVSLVVLIGGIVGLASGLYAQAFISRWTAYSSGYLVPYEPAVTFGSITFLQVLILALLAASGPAYFAANVRPRVGEIE